MPPVAQHKRIYRGEAKTFDLLITDEETEAPLDLTTLAGGDGIEFSVAEKDGAKTVTFQKTIGAGIEIVTPHTGDSIGMATVTIETADTQDLSALRQRYEVALVVDDERYIVIPPSDFIISEVVSPPA